MTNNELLPLCECGKCGLRVAKKGNRFIYGHNRRGVKRSQFERDIISKSRIGVSFSHDHCVALTDAFLKEKNPLPEGQKKSIPENKNCASYLGNIAEELLSRTFKNVKRMPNNNPGFDIICDQDFKIDVKSAATGYQGFWQFGVGRNEIADYFLCVAFESREKLIPTHIWLIPGKDINHLGGITINKKKLIRWAKYEQPINKAILCCDEMKNV